MPNTLILTSNDWWHIFKHNQNHSLNKINIHEYHYIVGPYNLNMCHWLAVMISLKSKKFIVLDPKGNRVNLHSKCYQSWIEYYKRREDNQIDAWDHDIHNFQHPIQSSTDNHNCGVFVCNALMLGYRKLKMQTNFYCYYF